MCGVGLSEHRLGAALDGPLRSWRPCEGKRAHVEPYIHGFGEAGLMASWTSTMMHGVRGFFRFAHIDGLIPADPAVYARLPKGARRRVSNSLGRIGHDRHVPRPDLHHHQRRRPASRLTPCR